MAQKLPPAFRQEKEDNCALACMRSICAYHGIEVSEAELEILAKKQSWGVEIEDLRLAAQSLGLDAQIEALDLPACAKLISAAVFPIVYLNRLHLEKRFPVVRRRALASYIPHAVIPVRISRAFVTYNDPLAGRRRRSALRKFTAAQADMGQWCVICRRRPK
jgi:ABC-type bacteriocin/lantibiotic exporter with double-glycine peptidase domain